MTFVHTNKASKLVPSSLLPRSHSPWIFVTGSLYNSSSANEVRFATLYWQSSNVINIVLVRYHGVMWSRSCRHCEISKKLILNRTKPAKNTPLFSFPIHGALTWNICLRDALHAHVFSFTHNAVVLWLLRCLHPENQKKIFRFLHFYESKQMSLTQDLKWLLEHHSALQLKFITCVKLIVTLYCNEAPGMLIALYKSQCSIIIIITVNCFIQWARPQNMAVGDLDFYFTLYLYIQTMKRGWLMQPSICILDLPSSSLHFSSPFHQIVGSRFTISSPLFQNNWVKIHHRRNKVGWRFNMLYTLIITK